MPPLSTKTLVSSPILVPVVPLPSACASLKSRFHRQVCRSSAKRQATSAKRSMRHGTWYFTVDLRRGYGGANCPQ
jgi:hypothetical protein